ncbi:MAG: hypothetical protein ABSB71_07800 [Candidatus Bathyarchaeia archaeon]|jgi:hypothetical protein
MTTQTLEKNPIAELSPYEIIEARNARHRALIMQILKDYPEGLSVQQIIAKELDYFGYSFLTDNRLRELRKKGWAEPFGENPQKWRTTKHVS